MKVRECLKSIEQLDPNEVEQGLISLYIYIYIMYIFFLKYMNLEINHGGKGKLYIHSCGSTSEYFYLNKVEWDLNCLQTNVCIFF